MFACLLEFRRIRPWMFNAPCRRGYRFMESAAAQPTSHDTTVRAIVEKLHAFGIAPTRQRVQIAQVLFSRCAHLSADQLLAAVNAHAAHTSKATVYNTLNLFVRKKLVREVLVDPDRVFYDPNTTPHHHFYNVDTGEISDIAADDITFARLPDLPRGTVNDGVDVVVRIRAAAVTSD